MIFTLIHPSRSRPDKSLKTLLKWYNCMDIEVIISLDHDDPKLKMYPSHGEEDWMKVTVNHNRSAVDAINNAAKLSTGDVLIVVSDDTDCPTDWVLGIEKEVEGKTDWIMKTQDGIQPWIITMPVMDRAYYERTRNVYSPDFKHMFCDTWMTVMADISGRKITSALKFPHLNDSIKDDVRKRSDATWQEGERMFIQKIQQLPIEDLRKVQDRAMLNWIRNKTGRHV